MVHQSIVRDIAALNKGRVRDEGGSATVEGGGASTAALPAAAVHSYAGRAILCVGIEDMDERVAINALSQT